MISANARCSFASQNFTNHVTFRCPLPARRLTPTLLQERSIDCQCCRIHLSYGAAMPQREASRLILCGTICASCVARLIYASLTADFLVSTIIVIIPASGLFRQLSPEDAFWGECPTRRHMCDGIIGGPSESRTSVIGNRNSLRQKAHFVSCWQTHEQSAFCQA